MSNIEDLTTATDPGTPPTEAVPYVPRPPMPAASVATPRAEPLDINRLRHPTESSRFALAITACGLTLSVAAFVLLALGQLLSLLLTLGGLVASAWLFLQIWRIRLLADAVLVTQDTLPELQTIMNDIRERLDYRRRLDLFVVNKIGKERGPVALTSFFGVKVLIVEGDAVSDFANRDERDQLFFLLATQVGALKARHTGWYQWLTVLQISGVPRVLSLLVNPWLRATVYSGDRIAYACCGDPDSGLQAIYRMMVGKGLAPHLRPEGLERQALIVRRRPLLRLAQILQPVPHTTNRFLELLAFIRETDDSPTIRAFAERALAGRPTPPTTLPSPNPAPPNPPPTHPSASTRPLVHRPDRLPTQPAGSGVEVSDQGDASMPESAIPRTQLIGPGLLLIGAALVSPFVELQVPSVAPWALAVVGVLMLAAPTGLRPVLAAATIGAALPVLAGPPLASLPFDLVVRGDVESAVLPPAMIVAAAGWCLPVLRPVARRGRLAWGWQIAVAILAALVVIASSPTRSVIFWVQADAEFAFVPAAALAVGLVPRRVGMALIGGFAVSTAAAVADWVSQGHGIDRVAVWTLLTLTAMTLIAAVAALRVQPSPPPTVTPPQFSLWLVTAAGVLAVAAAILNTALVADPEDPDLLRLLLLWILFAAPSALPAAFGIAAMIYRSPVPVGLFAASMGWSGFYVAIRIPSGTHVFVILGMLLAVAAELIILLAIARTTIHNGAWLWGSVAALLSIGVLGTVAVPATDFAGPAYLGAASLAVVALAAIFRRPTHLGAALLGGLGVGGLILVARLDQWAYGMPRDFVTNSYLSMLGVLVIAAGLAWLARRRERGALPVQ